MRAVDKLLVLVFAISIVPKDSTSKYVHRQTSGLCTFRGYRAASNRVDIPKIQAPVVKSEQMAITAISGYSAYGAGIAKESIDVINKFAKTVPVPKLAASLGIFGAAFGALAGISDLTADDILKVTDKAIKELTDEINKNFELMKEYVKHKVIKSDVGALTRRLKTFYERWKGCLLDHVDASEGKECQRDLANEIHRSYHEFLIFVDEMGSWNNIKYTELDDKILELEAFLIISRDYTNLGIKVIQTVVNEYKSDADKTYYNKYRQILEAFTRRSVNYIHAAYSWIEKFHITDGSKKCDQTFYAGWPHNKETRKVFWSTVVLSRGVETGCVIDSSYKPITYCKLSIEMLNGSSGRYSGRTHKWAYGKYFSWVYGAHGSYRDAAIKIGKPELRQHVARYYSKYKAAIQNYWHNEVMSLVPTWERVIRYAKNPRTTRPPCNRPPQFC